MQSCKEEEVAVLHNGVGEKGKGMGCEGSLPRTENHYSKYGS